MRRAGGLAVLLALAGCGGGDGTFRNEGIDVNQVERLSSPTPPPPADPNRSARIAPLAPEDLAIEGLVGPRCDFSRDGIVLVAVSAGDAIARVGGNLLHFTHSGPVGATGGFLEDRQVSISIGRIGAIDPADGAAGTWPGRITVTNRRDQAQVKLEGVWHCAG